MAFSAAPVLGRVLALATLAGVAEAKAVVLPAWAAAADEALVPAPALAEPEAEADAPFPAAAAAAED